MALTFGSGPLGPEPAGRFDVSPPDRPLLFWEPFRKRLRVVDAGETIVDSSRAIAVHETGKMMRLAVPWSDVHRESLSEATIHQDGRLGPLQGWSAPGRQVIARSIDTPPSRAAELAGHVILNLAKADAWYLEDDLGYAHPRDPYHRFDVHRSSRSVIVKAGSVVIAESKSPALLFETSTPVRLYVAPDAIKPGFLSKSVTVSQCPYKGDGQHWHVTADGARIADAAWSLTTPMGDALAIPHWVSFYPEKVDVEVDGEPWR